MLPQTVCALLSSDVLYAKQKTERMKIITRVHPKAMHEVATKTSEISKDDCQVGLDTKYMHN